MKVIDLLNKIANGEELPKQFIWQDRTFKLTNNKDYLYIDEYNCYIYEIMNLRNIKDEIEIIEEDKKIRNLNYVEENTFSKRQNGMTSEDRRLLDSNFKELCNKINEIIDCINKEK